MRKKLKSYLFKKLIQPIIHSTKPIEYKARGVAVGLAWAMTPLVGIQMALVGITWSIAKIFKWKFSLSLALIWTWVTNVITLPPVYYIFYVTGQMLRGNWEDISGYGTLKNMIETIFLSDIAFIEKFSKFCELFFIDWGVSLFIGCVPWVIIVSWAGYLLTIKYEKKRLKK